MSQTSPPTYGLCSVQKSEGCQTIPLRKNTYSTPSKVLCIPVLFMGHMRDLLPLGQLFMQFGVSCSCPEMKSGQNVQPRNIPPHKNQNITKQPQKIPNSRQVTALTQFLNWCSSYKGYTEIICACTYCHWVLVSKAHQGEVKSILQYTLHVFLLRFSLFDYHLKDFLKLICLF